jgi:hypothetical protein
MNTTSDGGNQQPSGVRGDPVVRDGQIDGTRDQMCNRINELEAALDHLRARLRELEKYARHAKECPRLPLWSPVRGRMEAGPCTCGLADLLAVLTEPPQEKNDEKTHENAVTRSAETDVTREVALPQRED